MIKKVLSQNKGSLTAGAKAVSEDDFLPPIQSAIFEISEDEIRGLFSTPVTLIPAQTGYAHIPVYSVWYKEAGTAYTVGAATNISIGPTTAQTLQGTGVSSLLIQAGERTAVMPYIGLGYSGSFTTISVVNLEANAVINNPLILYIAGGDVSGGTGKLYISLLWRTWKHGKLS